MFALVQSLLLLMMDEEGLGGSRRRLIRWVDQAGNRWRRARAVHGRRQTRRTLWISRGIRAVGHDVLPDGVIIRPDWVVILTTSAHRLLWLLLLWL